MSKLEEVARAICEADCGVVSENEMERCYGLARAAIEAIREPNEDMIPEYAHPGFAKPLWRDMIDAALGS